MIKNDYVRAIEKNETVDFILGRGSYFYLDRDRGIHDPTTTGMIMANFCREIGCHKFNEQFNKDLGSVPLEPFIESDTLQNILSIIFFFHTYTENDSSFNCNIEITPENVTRLIRCYDNLKLKNKLDLSIIDSLIERLQQRFGWPD